MRKKRKTKKDEIERLKNELNECKEKLLRLQADSENYRKQLDREKEEFMRYSNEKLITELLDVIDNFERAIKNSHDPGVKMIYNQFLNVLKAHGLKPIDALGKKFDPYYHEAFLQEESDKDEGTIIGEFQKGYMLNQRVIRHSKVKVAKNKGGNKK